MLDDADVAGAVASTGLQVMTHAGQGCAITTRLVLPRSRYDEGVEALVGAMASTPYGDPRDPRASGVAARMRTGTVAVNGGLFYGPDVPFGGYKQSGIGREMGVAGFEEYLETKAVAYAVRWSGEMRRRDG